MSGIIINIPTPKLINPTNQIMPVRDGNIFVDSNIKNVVDQYIETKNAVDQITGLRLDFNNNTFTLGDYAGLSISINTTTNEINFNGNIFVPVTVVPDKLIKIVNNGDVYYLQSYVEV
jgi:hypothetical protein